MWNKLIKIVRKTLNTFPFNLLIAMTQRSRNFMRIYLRALLVTRLAFFGLAIPSTGNKQLHVQYIGLKILIWVSRYTLQFKEKISPLKFDYQEKESRWNQFKCSRIRLKKYINEGKSHTNEPWIAMLFTCSVQIQFSL